ncbi:hypothetical protein GCK72_007327 [Caenorhabditis remanei]|uniref:Tudor-knot domain-containing protein n=1 Tax=Caenorhabditis remanei TaxID=31234 RepID=A0A6A5HHP6_CAERE|nr:hypothetical protein GCK72_007327 [Caenorhabditis remanei]KAF1767368.1 hypothetical protein GCK72_007327 [Caenorhabditis remanei]
MTEAEYKIGETFMCLYHNENFYNAKILGMEEIEGVNHYVIHYIGWNKRYDEKLPFGSERMSKGSVGELGWVESERQIPDSEQSSDSQRFDVGEEFVLMSRYKVPYTANVVEIKQIENRNYYVVRIHGWAPEYDETLAFGSIRMLKGTVQEYYSRRARIRND